LTHQQELNQAILLLVENGSAVSRAASITSWSHRTIGTVGAQGWMTKEETAGDEEAEELAFGKQNYTIKEFCLLYGISRTFYYELSRKGRAPDTIKIGKKVLIPRAAAENWNAAMGADGE